MSYIDTNNLHSIGSVDKINKKEDKEFVCEITLSFDVHVKGKSQDSVRKELEKTHPDTLYGMNSDYVDIKVDDIFCKLGNKSLGIINTNRPETLKSINDFVLENNLSKKLFNFEVEVKIEYHTDNWLNDDNHIKNRCFTISAPSKEEASKRCRRFLLDENNDNVDEDIDEMDITSSELVYDETDTYYPYPEEVF